MKPACPQAIGHGCPPTHPTACEITYGPESASGHAYRKPPMVRFPAGSDMQAATYDRAARTAGGRATNEQHPPPVRHKRLEDQRLAALEGMDFAVSRTRSGAACPPLMELVAGSRSTSHGPRRSDTIATQ